jgi:DNA primase
MRTVRRGVRLSVIEELRSLEERVVSRLAELRPLVEEYEQLQQVADRLGFDEQKPAARGARRRQRPSPRQRPSVKSSPSARQGRKPKPRRASSRRTDVSTKAVGAERRARILELIEQRPGITVPDLSRELGVDPPPLYRAVRKLQSDAVVRKEGKSLTLMP